MTQVHVLSGPERRRRFSLEQKRAIVAAASAPGVIVSEVARRADVCASLIYRWRRELAQARSGFAEVIVAPVIRGDERDGDDLGCLPSDVAARASGADAVVASAIEIELAGASRVRIPASTPADLASAVIAALLRR